MRSNFFKAIILSSLVAAVTIAGQTSALSTWVGAPSPAPSGNIPTPINSGYNTQTKLGALFLNTGNQGSSDFFDIGLSVFGKAIFNGNVQIATGSPAVGKVLTALDSNGTVGWGVAAAPACTTTDVPLGTYSINLNSGNNNHTYQLLVGDLAAGTYKLMGNGTWSSVGGGGALGIYHNTTQTWTTPPGAPAGATSVGTPEIYLYSVGNFVTYVQHYGGDSGTWTAGNGSNENTFTLTQTKNLYASAGQSAMSGSVSLYRVVSSCGGSSSGSAVSASGVSRIIAGTGVTVSPTGGTGDVTVGVIPPTPGLNLSDIRASLEYVSCTGGPNGGSASCTATCSVGKKVVGGGCSGTYRSGSGASATQTQSPHTSMPNATQDAWICGAGTGSTFTSVSVAGSAICI